MFFKHQLEIEKLRINCIFRYVFRKNDRPAFLIVGIALCCLLRLRTIIQRNHLYKFLRKSKERLGQ